MGKYNLLSRMIKPLLQAPLTTTSHQYSIPLGQLCSLEFVLDNVGLSLEYQVSMNRELYLRLGRLRYDTLRSVCVSSIALARSQRASEC